MNTLRPGLDVAAALVLSTGLCLTRLVVDIQVYEYLETRIRCGRSACIYDVQNDIC